ncbi:Carbon monoxide dehydrogenase form I, large chain [Candidatus Paraburkholderia kirkii]|nr:Carbon monoxide dehydrogenase form I, large chain [Candidatus Paraburkholderia kirkii]
MHPCPLETCGCVASFDKARGDLLVYITSQAPHVVRTVVGMLSSIPESKIRIVSPDIGGGFGNKVGVYPGYVTSIVASIVFGRPVKWIESRSENLSSTAFARDYHMTGELAADSTGRIKALRVNVVADHGAFDVCTDPTKWPAGTFHVCTGSYDIPNAFVAVDGVYTNKFPGGVAYRCSFRVTEAVYLIERMVDVLAQKLGIDKAEIRLCNFIRKEQFPYTTPLGLEYDSGDYEPALRKVLAAVDYPALRAEQAQRRADPAAEWLMGVGIVTFTEIVGAGPSKMCDILGVGMFDSCEIRVHPDGSAIARMGTITQGQGYQTTYAQIIASEAGIPASVITVEEGNLLGGTLMDYFVPTAVETPHWDTDFIVTPSPHHPIGAKGVAESPHVGSIPCFTSAIVDVFAHLGVTHMNMPHNAFRVWQQSRALGLTRQ